MISIIAHFEEIIDVLVCHERNLNGRLCPSLSQSTLLRAYQGQVSELISPEYDKLNHSDGKSTQLFKFFFDLIKDLVLLVLNFTVL